MFSSIVYNVSSPRQKLTDCTVGTFCWNKTSEELRGISYLYKGSSVITGMSIHANWLVNNGMVVARWSDVIHLIIICLFFLFFHHFIGLGWNSNWPLGYFANLDQASRSSEIVWVKRFLQDRANLKSFCSDAGCFFLEKFLQDFGQKLFWGEGSAGIVMPLVHFCLLLFSPRHNKCNYGPHPFL